MATLAPPLWAGLFLLSLSAAGVVLLITQVLSKKAPSKLHATSQTYESHFLLEAERLVDHNVADLPVESTVMESMRSWSDLAKWLQPRFASLPASLSDLDPNQTAVFVSSEGVDSSTLQIIRDDSFTRVVLEDNQLKSPAAWHSALLSMQTSNSANSVLQSSPDPIWRTNAAGQVIWKNAACSKILDENGDLPQINEKKRITDASSAPRIAIVDEESGRNRWYELRKLADGDDQVHFATDITQVIQAETVQREFVQTLTKTFANLTTGLAIFDKSNRLALFNPALVDLTNVPVAFLSDRPDLMDFFDQLREQQMLPEPKNYANWRAQVRDAVAQASNGLYQEIWTLPNGMTYRVTGRPHPDGAVAFLFEDISDDISLTRRFRTQIELHQSVLDGMDDAVAVISASNVLLFCNKSCNELFRIDPDTSFADMSLKDLLTVSQDFFGNNLAFKTFKDQILSDPSSDSFGTIVDAADGTSFECKTKPLPGGLKMLVFSQIKQPSMIESGVKMS